MAAAVTRGRARYDAYHRLGGEAYHFGLLAEGVLYYEEAFRVSQRFPDLRSAGTVVAHDLGAIQLAAENYQTSREWYLTAATRFDWSRSYYPTPVSTNLDTRELAARILHGLADTYSFEHFAFNVGVFRQGGITPIGVRSPFARRAGTAEVDADGDDRSFWQNDWRDAERRKLVHGVLHSSHSLTNLQSAAQDLWTIASTRPEIGSWELKDLLNHVNQLYLHSVWLLYPEMVSVEGPRAMREQYARVCQCFARTLHRIGLPGAAEHVISEALSYWDGLETRHDDENMRYAGGLQDLAGMKLALGKPGEMLELSERAVEVAGKKASGRLLEGYFNCLVNHHIATSRKDVSTLMKAWRISRRMRVFKNMMIVDSLLGDYYASCRERRMAASWYKSAILSAICGRSEVKIAGRSSDSDLGALLATLSNLMIESGWGDEFIGVLTWASRTYTVRKEIDRQLDEEGNFSPFLGPASMLKQSGTLRPDTGILTVCLMGERWFSGFKLGTGRWEFSTGSVLDLGVEFDSFSEFSKRVQNSGDSGKYAEADWSVVEPGANRRGEGGLGFAYELLPRNLRTELARSMTNKRRMSWLGVYFCDRTSQAIPWGLVPVSYISEQKNEEVRLVFDRLKIFSVSHGGPRRAAPRSRGKVVLAGTTMRYGDPFVFLDNKKKLLTACASSEMKILHIGGHSVVRRTGNTSEQGVVLGSGQRVYEGDFDSVYGVGMVECTILSACWSISGSSGDSKDLLSLPTGFLLRGGSIVIATIWAIPEDAHTRQLEENVLRRLAACSGSEMEYIEALTDIQIIAAKHGDSFGDVKHWAAYTAIAPLDVFTLD
ncbi:tetratricopeptide repeat protein, partial [Millisia brevis]|uniref:tetratricopeptide repeat protein n=1 Tax=Millisia brevis TaxID=264148 RepID=UPI001471C4F8